MTRFLGQNTVYPETYSPDILEPISRKLKRNDLKYRDKLSVGFDDWSIFEASHLDLNFCPKNYLFRLIVPANSSCLVESKSMKLYFFSMNNECIDSSDYLKRIHQDLNRAFGTTIQIKVIEKLTRRKQWPDMINLDCQQTTDSFLLCDSVSGHFIYSSTLFRSRCPITNQPDWAHLFIETNGAKKFNNQSLSTYLMSYRNTNEFHEHCCERILSDLIQSSQEEISIAVMMWFTRRGGIDINPYRSFGNEKFKLKNWIDQRFWDPRF